MSDEESGPDVAQFYAILDEHRRWATLHVTIDEIARDNVDLVRDLARYEKSDTVSLLSGLLTLPKYQSNCIRLEILVALAILYCRGQKTPGTNEIVRWFSQIEKSRCVTGEDPPEDVFVALVQSEGIDYRMLEGVWEAAGFYTQRVLDVVETMPDTGRFGQIRQAIRALLVISDLICERSGLWRYQLGADERNHVLSPSKLPARKGLVSRVTMNRPGF